ncbi:MAG TPA: prephenate dehydrogenase/arogenate dehydrogenase family protein, partial [Pirellulaceae bacterium]|nr:prephenate dehydrogenase/arogenate dehydrogenase family protein [Pirellulaceae bacterium]
LARGAITHATTDLARGVSDAQLVVVCTPVATIVPTIRTTLECVSPGALVTDAGSTKASIVAACEEAAASGSRGRFVGSHPMAGSHKTGVDAATADLFVDRKVIVTPTDRTPLDATTEVKQFWQSLGAQLVELTPDAHDEAVAAISHLPHLVAATLAGSTPRELVPLAAGGWRDSTRIAGGDPELWRQILTDNRGHVLRALDRLMTNLSEIKRSLADGDDASLLRHLEAGKGIRDALGN